MGRREYSLGQQLAVAPQKDPDIKWQWGSLQSQYPPKEVTAA